MGECAYYLKAQFKSKKAAKIAAAKIDDFLAEATDASNFYDHNNDSLKVPPKTFWKEFESKFPLTFDYVKTLPGFKMTADPQTVLSGNLDFGQDENNETLVQSTTVCWGDACVWHMADWTLLCNYIVKKFGAIKAVWDTEENGCGSLDHLQLYDYEKIVNDILNQKDALPLLLGVNEDLNLLIDIKIKNQKK